MSDSVYPANLDTFVDPLGTDAVSVVDHALNHRKANDAALALETKVGIDGSAVGNTIDYLLKNVASIDPGHHHTNSSIDSLAVSKLTGGQALTNVNDTNLVLTLGGSPSVALLSAVSLTLSWAGTLAAARLNSNVVQGVSNDTNVTGSISAQNLTLGWSGTLAAARLNSNVVQAITNDTNVNGSISAQNLTLSWAGTLAAARLNSNVVQAITNDTNVTGSITTQNLTLGWTGLLAIARGGTNAATASAAFNNLSPMSALGDLIYGGTAGTGTRLAGNTTATKNFLVQTGNGSVSAAPSWGIIAAADLPSTVVTSIVNDTNVTGSIAAQALTLGWTGQLSLSRGGTNNNLTASNGGIVWSDASKLQILAGNATAGLALISGASATPSWFAPTAGQVLYAGTGGILASSANHVWDNTNNRLGINVASPSNPLEVSGTGELILSTYRVNMVVKNNNSGGNTGFGIKNLGTAAIGTSVSFVGTVNRITGGESFAGQFVWTVQDAGNTTFSTDMAIQTTTNNVLNNNIYIDKSGNIQFLNIINKYNNINTVGNGVPSEVATIDSTALTANVAASTLYAVPASGAGMYRVSTYVVETVAGSISSTLPNVQIVFTDKDSNTSITIDATPILGVAGIGQTGALTSNTVGTASSGVIVIYVKASTTIQYQTVNYASNLAGMTYALRIKLEAL